MKNEINAKKIEQFIQADKIYGPIVHAEHGDSCDRIGEPRLLQALDRIIASPIRPELVSEVSVLFKCLDSLVKKLDSNRASRVLTLTENLAIELEKPNPDRQQTSLSVQGILSAANTISELADPIAKSVKAILALIGFGSVQS